MTTPHALHPFSEALLERTRRRRPSLILDGRDLSIAAVVDTIADHMEEALPAIEAAVVARALGCPEDCPDRQRDADDPLTRALHEHRLTVWRHTKAPPITFEADHG